MFENEEIVPGRNYTPGELESLLAQRETRRAAERRAADLKAVRESALHRAMMDMFEDAQRAQPYRAHVADGHREAHAYSATTLKRGLFVPLRETKVIGLFDKNGQLTHTPAGALAGEVLTLEGALIANSRVARAGAHVIVRPDGSKVHTTTGTQEALTALTTRARLVDKSPHQI